MCGLYSIPVQYKSVGRLIRRLKKYRNLSLYPLPTISCNVIIFQGARVDTTDHYDNSPFHYAIKLESKSLLEVSSGYRMSMQQ